MFKDYVVLHVDGIAIVGQLFLPDSQGTCKMVCLCHGAPSGNPPEPGDGGYPALAERFCQAGLGTFFFNFRGSGESDGNFDPGGWVNDLRAVVEYLWDLPSIDRSPLYLVGFSAGAAVAIHVAAKDKRIAGVVACASPAEITARIGDGKWELVIDNFRKAGAIRDAGFPPSVAAWAAGCNMVNPAGHIGAIAPRPVLIIHGDQDSVVPLADARRLYKNAGDPKKLKIIKGAGHKLRRDEKAVSAMLKWLEAR